jgi:hypothetical protein
MEGSMKRVFGLLAIAVVGGALVAGAGGALAKNAPKGKAVKLTCRVTLTQQPAPGQDAVLPADSGDHYGRINCPHGFGWGVIHDSFTVPDSGDTVAKYVAYFNGGTFSGGFTLTPGGGEELSDTSFQSSSWSGTMTVRGGTGIYKGISVKKKGKLSCTSADSAHLKCSETISLVLPSA